MALRRNSFLAGILVAAAWACPSAMADDSTITNREPDHRNDYLDDNYIYDYMGHQDSITTGLGDAPTSNLVIMHPTPWPSYINKTKIQTPSVVGLTALENMMQSLAPDASATTTVNTGPGQAPMTATTSVSGISGSASGGN